MKRIGLLIILCYLFEIIDRINIGMAVPDISKTFHVSPTISGVLLSSFFWGYIVMMVPGGWIAQRYSAKWVILVAMGLWAIFAGLTGVMSSVSGLIVVRVLLGLAEGVVWPAFMILISRWFPANERARFAALLLMMIPVSTIVMAPLAGWMIATWSWRMMFFLQAIPPLILAIFVMIYLADSPSKDKRLSHEERDYITAAVSLEPQNQRSVSIWQIIRAPQLWMLGLIFLFWNSGQYAFSLWLPTAMKDISHQGIEVVGLLAAIPSIVGMVVMYANGRFSDRGGDRSFYVIWPLILAGLALIASRLAMPAWVAVLVLSLAAAGLYSPFGPWWAWCVESVPIQYIGVALGLVDMIGNAGGIVGPPAVAMAAGGGSLVTGLYVLGIGVLLSAGLATYVGLSNRKKPVAVSTSG
jgi:MFS family permease